MLNECLVMRFDCIVVYYCRRLRDCYECEDFLKAKVTIQPGQRSQLKYWSRLKTFNQCVLVGFIETSHRRMVERFVREELPLLVGVMWFNISSMNKHCRSRTLLVEELSCFIFNSFRFHLRGSPAGRRPSQYQHPTPGCQDSHSLSIWCLWWTWGHAHPELRPQGIGSTSPPWINQKPFEVTSCSHKMKIFFLPVHPLFRLPLTTT